VQRLGEGLHEVRLGASDAVSGLGVYVHVPFCRRRCEYCAFATYVDRDHLMDRYVAALRADIERAASAGSLTGATAVFVGGGTPSRLPAHVLCSVLAAIPTVPGAEITVECNPEDVTVERLAAYRDAGVTRLSLGVQAQAGHVLASLGRHHRWEEAVAAAGLVAAGGFASWNLDLIFGAAAETDEDWAEALAGVLGLSSPPPHVSAYALTVEPGTPLAKDPARHPDDDVQARRYTMADEVLSAAGYRWEEISNWARPGHTCTYNNIAWSGGNYLGFGSAAHSHRDGRRWWNVRTPERYIAAGCEARSPVAGEETLSVEQRAFERLALALRTPGGVPVSALEWGPELDGLVERHGGRAVLTVAGRMLASEVSMRLRTGHEERPEAAGILPR
jgi:putative oxygen-independent coproporphyrinogen III oxidase